MKTISNEPIKNKGVLSLFGHLIKSNRQVHDFQYIVIHSYLEHKNISDAIVVIKDVIFETPNSIDLSKAASLFLTETSAIQNEIYWLLVVISKIDGFVDNSEVLFFNQLDSYIGHLGLRKKYQVAARIQAEELRKNLKEMNSDYRTGTRIKGHDNLFRISQAEYLKTMDECRFIAREDFNKISPICQQTISSAEALVYSLNKKIQSFKNNSKEQEVAEILDVFSRQITNGVVAAANEYKERLSHKESAVEDFTIVLVGRTKSGKSTLKTVLTGSGKDEIGKGKQRTTLINYIYEWNHLRIIDTPGIGAGEDIYEEDKKIAERALAEADVVCYLTPSDGVPKDTKQFINEIIYSNKPVILLVNYKNNIRDEDNFEDFLDDPTEWCADKGTNSLKGYFDPILRELKDKGYERMISYHPVFLLAALMAEEEKYLEYSEILRSNSGIDEFLEALKIIVAEQGTFLRSKTIIDDTIGNCNSWKNEFEASLEPVKALLKSLNDNEDETFKKIEKAKEQLIKNSEKVFEQQYKTLSIQHAKAFSEKYYKEDDLDEKWKIYCKNISFQERLEAALMCEIEAFANAIQDIFEDLITDIQYELNNERFSFNIDIKMDLFPAREVTRIFSRLLGIGGAFVLITSKTSLIGWALTGAAIVFGLISDKFKDKADREKVAQDKLYNKLKDVIEEQAEQNKKSFKQLMVEETDNVLEDVKKTYSNIQKGLNDIVKESEILKSAWSKQINELNMTFAKRILNYIEPNNNYQIVNVERVFGDLIQIKLKNGITLDTCKLEGLIRDNVTFV